jgi:hypothetical protein
MWAMSTGAPMRLVQQTVDTSRTENRTEKSRSVQLLFFILYRPFLNMCDKNRNGQKWDEFENGLIIFHPLERYPVLTR